MLTKRRDGQEVTNVFIEEELPGISYCGVKKNRDWEVFFQQDMFRKGDARTGQVPSTRSKETPRFLSKGYSLLKPVTELEIISNRQAVIRAFIEDPCAMQEYGELLNVMSLIHEYIPAEGRTLFSNSNAKIASALEEYIRSTEVLLQKFSIREGILESLAQDIRTRTKTQSLKTTIAAAKKGSFDYLIMRVHPPDEKNPLHRLPDAVRLQGGIGVFVPKDFLSGGMILPTTELERTLGSNTNRYEFQNFLTSESIGDQKGYVSYAVNLALDHLSELYAPFAALWTEAEYFLRRKKEGLPVCIPEINTAGVFSIGNGEPLVEVEKKPVGISLNYLPKKPRILLWGLHSGGKTVSLQLIAHYHIAGLSGFCLPAQNAEIPVINNIYHAFDVEYSSSGGRLQQDERYLARLAKKLQLGDLVLIDEFLQHASPDAAEALEPEILGEFESKGAVVALVSHRGNDRSGGWQVYSPGYSEEKGVIRPSYQLQEGHPDVSILERFATQLFEQTCTAAPFEKVTSPLKANERLNTHDIVREHNEWTERVEKIIFKSVRM